MLIFFGGLLLGWRILLAILIVVAPFLLLLGAIPGWGKRVTLKWLESILNLFLKTIVLSLMLLVFSKLYAAILDLSLIWFIQTILSYALISAIWTARGLITKMLTSSVNIGGGGGGLAGGQEIARNLKSQTAVLSKGTYKAVRGVAGFTGKRIENRLEKRSEKKAGQKAQENVQNLDKGINKDENLVKKNPINSSNLTAREAAERAKNPQKFDTRKKREVIAKGQQLRAQKQALQTRAAAIKKLPKSEQKEAKRQLVEDTKALELRYVTYSRDTQRLYGKETVLNPNLRGEDPIKKTQKYNKAGAKKRKRMDYRSRQKYLGERLK